MLSLEGYLGGEGSSWGCLFHVDGGLGSDPHLRKFEKEGLCVGWLVLHVQKCGGDGGSPLDSLLVCKAALELCFPVSRD